MTNGATLDCDFEKVDVHQGRLPPKILTGNDARATIQKNSIYLGSGYQWELKTKDITEVNLDAEERTIRIITSKGYNCFLQNCHDEKTFESFCKRLQSLYEKHNSESAKELSNFLVTSSKVGLGKKFHRKQATSTSKPARKRGTFGRAGRSATKAPERMPWDDEVEEDSLDYREKSFEMMEPEPLSKEDAQNESKTTASPPHPASQSKSRLRKLTTKKRSIDNLSGSESDDDDPFNVEAALTTPAAQRVVSPSGGTLQKTSVKTTDKELPREKGQITLSAYFQKKQERPTSFDPAKRSAVFTPEAPKTPERTPTTTQSPGRLVLSTGKRVRRHDDDWLAKSEAKVPSASKLQSERLFGQKSIDWVLNEEPIEDYDEDDIKVGPPSDSGRSRTPFGKRFRHPQPRLHPRPKYMHSPLYRSPALVNLEKHLSKTERSLEPDLRNLFRGIRNLGNTCYMSASLQMICTVKDTIQSLEGRSGNLTGSVVAVAGELTDNTTLIPVNPSAVKEAMDQKTDKFLGYEQRDAHEFLSDLVDYIHEEVIKKDSLTDNGDDQESKSEETPEPSPMDDFLLTVRVVLSCKSCGYTRSKEETYRHISIDIVDEETGTGGKVTKASVEKSLAHFFQPEIREIKCEKCTEGTHASQTLQVVNCPKVLLLHLKRFIFVEKRIETPAGTGDENQSPNSPSSKNKSVPVEYVFQKNKAPVSIAETLTLDPFQVEDKEDMAHAFPSKEYKLKSIVHHIGSRASSGHYTADAVRRIEPNIVAAAYSNCVVDAPKEAEDGWVTFDDGSSCITTLEKITANQNKQRTAYMLLYSLE